MCVMTYLTFLLVNAIGLRVLILNDVGAITDLSYVTVFRHLPLRSFYHYSSTGCVSRHKLCFL